MARETEASFQTAVLAFARLHGWIAYHTHDARRSNPGFPDLVLVRRERLVFAELKSDKGRERPDQTVWLDALEVVEKAAPDAVGVYLWRPSSWEQIRVVLT